MTQFDAIVNILRRTASLAQRVCGSNQLSVICYVDQFEPVRYRFKDSDPDNTAEESPVPQRRQDPPGGATNPLLVNGQAQSLRQVNYERILLSKRRVVKMLCVVVLEYFLCWTPLFLVNTWTVMDYLSARRNVTLLTKALVFLLAYLSSCVHPITYCFMNRRFRQSFLEMFACCGQRKRTRMLDETSNMKSSKRSQLRTTSSTTLRFSSLRKI
ncbi:cholecystokinin receptor type A-like [Gigantopelta aegis]|uniref:cholecystokinin receptor type A-like n=1 Tax=Gigantopelta aegis TaxID=1735272 RepID=UPI001B889949|nr:cholecystokinin receptor type A-like [Gigantopelta aegis]